MQRPRLTSRSFAEPGSSFCLWDSQVWRGRGEEAGDKAPQKRRAEEEQWRGGARQSREKRKSSRDLEEFKDTLLYLTSILTDTQTPG